MWANSAPEVQGCSLANTAPLGGGSRAPASVRQQGPANVQEEHTVISDALQVEIVPAAAAERLEAPAPPRQENRRLKKLPDSK